MNSIKFKILTPSKLLIQEGFKKIIISGEATITPIFYADKKSINTWKTFFGEKVISKEEKNQLIEYITNESKKTKVPIIFE